MYKNMSLTAGQRWESCWQIVRQNDLKGLSLHWRSIRIQVLQDCNVILQRPEYSECSETSKSITKQRSMGDRIDFMPSLSLACSLHEFLNCLPFLFICGPDEEHRRDVVASPSCRRKLQWVASSHFCVHCCFEEGLHQTRSILFFCWQSNSTGEEDRTRNVPYSHPILCW